MQLLFERWRRYLNEADPFAATPLAKPTVTKVPRRTAVPPRRGDIPEETREKYFGANPDHLQCIQDLRKTPAQASDRQPHITDDELERRAYEFYDCMNRAGYSKLGEGSFRAVFNIPNKPHLVLKTPNPARMLESLKNRRDIIEMNKREAQGAFQTTSDLVVKVYDGAEDYFWIVSEKVTEIKTWDVMQEFFPVWKHEPAGDFNSWFQKLINPKTLPDVAAEQINKQAEYRAEYDMDYDYEEKGKELVNDPLILDIRDLLGQFKLPAWDIRPHNVGHAIRNGQKQFVIIDPGFGLDGLGIGSPTARNWTPAAQMDTNAAAANLMDLN